MTFIDPAQSFPHLRGGEGPRGRVRRIAIERRRVADEDGARKALGHDPMMPKALLAGAALEDLARIALG